MSTTETITGRVVDQDQNPISNAAVLSHSITEPALDESDARSLERQAEDLRDDLTDPLPSSWDPNYDLESHSEDANGDYLLVHESDDWGLGTTTSVSSSIDDPRLQVDSDQRVVLSLWDPSNDEGLIGNQIDNSFPGVATDGTIIIEQKGPTGETVDRMEEETTTIATTTGGRVTGENEHPGIRTHLPNGVYVAYPEGARERGYTFIVGSPDQLASAWEEDLRDEADQLTDRAQRIRDLLNQDHVTRTTVRTSDGSDDLEPGEFELRVPSNAVTTDLKAIKADGTILEGIENPSMEDLREAQAGGFNGTFYLPSPEPNTVEPPAEGVEVTVYRSPEVPLGDMSSFADLMQFLENQRLNETIDELRSEYDQRLEEMERDSLEQTYQNHRLLVETAPGAEERYLERSDFEEIQAAEDLTNDELGRETRHMQVALANVDMLDPPDVGSGIIEVSDDGLLSAEYPLVDGVDHDTISVELRDSTGNYQPVDEEYWHVDSGGFGSSDTVVIEDVPVDNTNAAMYELRVQAAAEEDDGITPGDSLPGSGQDGGVLDDRVSAPNPTYGGSIPELDAVDFSTISPGPSERVHVDLEPADDTGYGQLVQAEAWNANGDPVNATVDSDADRASFRTDGDGVHEVRLTFENEQGDRFVVSERVRAHQQSRADPATIRTSESILGDHAIVGERLESARIETTGSTLRVDAIARDSVGPSELNVYPGEKFAGTDTIDVSVLHGSDEARVNSNVLVNIHVENHPEDALHWRNGQAFAADGSDNIGHVMRPNEDKAIIQTRTDENGHVSVTVEQDPNLLDRANHRISRLAASVPNPLGMIGSGLFTLVAGLIVRRRYFA